MQADHRTKPEVTTVAAAVAAGVLMSLAGGFVISWLQIRFGMNPMTSSGTTPVPLSALAVGAIAMGVFVVVMNVLGLQMRRRLHLASGALVGLGMMLFCHRFCFQHVQATMLAPGNGVGYVDFAHSMITNTALPGGPAPSGMSFGSLGYARAAAQLLAFAVGGWAVAPHIGLGRSAEGRLTASDER